MLGFREVNLTQRSERVPNLNPSNEATSKMGLQWWATKKAELTTKRGQECIGVKNAKHVCMDNKDLKQQQRLKQILRATKSLLRDLRYVTMFVH